MSELADLTPLQRKFYEEIDMEFRCQGWNIDDPCISSEVIDGIKRLHDIEIQRYMERS